MSTLFLYIGSPLKELRILSNAIWRNIPTRITKTLSVTITKNVGHVTRACVSWSMMSIWGVQCFGTSRTEYLAQYLPSDGKIVLCQYTAKTIRICCSTCLDLNVGYFPKLGWPVKNLHIVMVFGIYKMKYVSCYLLFFNCVWFQLLW